jgi:hypothetical protein
MLFFLNCFRHRVQTRHFSCDVIYIFDLIALCKIFFFPLLFTAATHYQPMFIVRDKEMLKTMVL